MTSEITLHRKETTIKFVSPFDKTTVERHVASCSDIRFKGLWTDLEPFLNKRFLKKCSRVFLRTLPDAPLDESPNFAFLELYITGCENEIHPDLVPIFNSVLKQTKLLSFRMPTTATRFTISSLFVGFKGVLNINSLNTVHHVYMNTARVCPSISLLFDRPHPATFNKVVTNTPFKIHLQRDTPENVIFDALWNPKRRATLVHKSCTYLPGRTLYIKKCSLPRTQAIISMLLLLQGDPTWSKAKASALCNPDLARTLKSFLV